MNCDDLSLRPLSELDEKRELDEKLDADFQRRYDALLADDEIAVDVPASQSAQQFEKNVQRATERLERLRPGPRTLAVKPVVYRKQHR